MSFRQPGPNSKSISVLGKSKSKSYLASQHWASLNRSLTSLESLNQDLDYTWKLIPKSKPTFQKISSDIFEFKKNFATCHDFCIYFCALSRNIHDFRRFFRLFSTFFSAIFDVSPAILDVFLAIFDGFFGYFWRFFSAISDVSPANFDVFFRLFLTFPRLL